MISYLKKIYTYLVQKKKSILYKFKLKEIIAKNSDFLSEGTFKLFTTNGKVIIHLENEETALFIKKHYQNLFKNYRKRIYNLFDPFFKFKVTNSLNKKFSGQIIIITIEKDIKIFDFKICQVLTKYQDKEKIFQIKSALAILDPFFQNTILHFSDHYQVEELIGKEANQKCFSQLTNSEKDNAFRSLMLNYKKYFNQLSSQSLQYISLENICKQLRKEKYENVCDRIEKIILHSSSFNSILQPRVFLHGDLHYGNILIDNERVKLIDFERSGDYILVYDFFNFICEEIVSQNNYLFLEAYYNCKYDDLLFDFFNQLEMTYDVDKKIEYLIFFLAERILKRGFFSRELRFLNDIEKLL